MVWTQTPRVSGVVAGLWAVVGCLAGLAAGPARGDEDIRKFASSQPPVYGPIWRLGDPIPAGKPISAGDDSGRGGFESSGMTLLSHIPLNNFTGVARASGNDCWGYLSPSGREYAIMGLEGGFGFVEVTNPTNPVVIETIPGPSSPWHDVKVIGDIAYGVSEGGAGIQIMDLSDIDAGQVALVRNWTSGGYSTTHNIVSNPEAGTLWVVGSNIGNGGLVHVNLTNPTLPFIDGGWTDMYVHDAQVVNWTTGALAGRQIAFCAAGFDIGQIQTGLRVVDVTNPNSPQLLATMFYPGGAYTHQVWLSDDRKYLYLNDELDEGLTVAVTTTRIINVEDPANPFLVGTATTGLPSIDHNLYVHEGLMYQANYRSGLRVFDTLDPEHPVQIAYFDTYPGSNDTEFNGAWSNYPFFPSGSILISDIERGLFVVRLDAEPAQVAVSLDSDAPDFIDPAGGAPLTARTIVRSPSNPVGTVELFVDAGSGFVPYGAADNGDGTYTALLPPVACGVQARAYFRATTTGGDTATFPADAPASTLSFTVSSAQTVVFADDFQTSQGWQVTGSASDAGEGRWERAVPSGDGSRGDPASDADASGFCFVTGDGGPGSNTDVDGSSTVLTSPAIDASGAGDARLSYARWYNNAAGASPNADVFTVEISGDNGAGWTVAEVVGPDGPGTGGGWVEQSLRVADYITPTAQVRLRFTASDTGEGSVVEAGVDGVELLMLECVDAPDCPADLNGDGELNFFDLSDFLALYNAQDAGADLNSDGLWNFFDVSNYLSQYNAGCP